MERIERRYGRNSMLGAIEAVAKGYMSSESMSTYPSNMLVIALFTGYRNRKLMLTIPHCKESLSRAYVTAVVGRARHNLCWTREHDYGVDGTIRELQKRGTRITESGIAVDFQAKSTVDWEFEADSVVYDLEATAFNDLVSRAANRTMPLILILLCLHKEESQWLEQNESELRLRNCVYWHRLDGTVTNNTSTKRIQIPRQNLFDVTAVERLLAATRRGEFAI